METRPSPEFGPNGAVMNNPAMGDRLRAEYRDEDVPRHLRRPETLRGRLIASGGRLFLVASWSFLVLRNERTVFLPLAGFVTFMAAANVIRSIWPMGPLEKSLWEAALRLGALAGFLAGTWWLAPIEPVWIRTVASVLLTACVLRSFWKFGRVGGWLWGAAAIAGIGLVVWAGM